MIKCSSEEAEDWDLDDIMDLDDEDNINADDTFASDGVQDRTTELVRNARRDMGLTIRSPSPAGSASSVEHVEEISKRKKSRKSLKANSEAVKMVTRNVVKETMKMMKQGTPVTRIRTFLSYKTQIGMIANSLSVGINVNSHFSIKMSAATMHCKCKYKQTYLTCCWKYPEVFS